MLELDLGPEFGSDISGFDLIFELDSCSPLSPFSDDQDESEHSGSSCSSHPHFPPFESLTSFVDIDGWEPSTYQFSLNSASDSTLTHPYQTIYAADPFNFSSPSISDAYGGDSGTLGEDFGDWDLATGDALIELFLQDLQRMLPGDVLFEFDTPLLKELDVRLLFAPGEVFDDVCWAELSQPKDSSRWKPRPDVPSSFADKGNDPMEVCTLVSSGGVAPDSTWALTNEKNSQGCETSPFWVDSASDFHSPFYRTESAWNMNKQCHPFAIYDER